MSMEVTSQNFEANAAKALRDPNLRKAMGIISGPMASRRVETARELPEFEALRDEGDLLVGDNLPYSGRDHSGYSIFEHGQNRGLHHVMIEVRQDLVASEAGIAEWAGRLERCFRRMLTEAGILAPSVSAA